MGIWLAFYGGRYTSEFHPSFLKADPEKVESERLTIPGCASTAPHLSAQT